MRFMLVMACAVKAAATGTRTLLSTCDATGRCLTTNDNAVSSFPWTSSHDTLQRAQLRVHRLTSSALRRLRYRSFSLPRRRTTIAAPLRKRAGPGNDANPLSDRPSDPGWDPATDTEATARRSFKSTAGGGTAASPQRGRAGQRGRLPKEPRNTAAELAARRELGRAAQKRLRQRVAAELTDPRTPAARRACLEAQRAAQSERALAHARIVGSHATLSKAREAGLTTEQLGAFRELLNRARGADDLRTRIKEMERQLAAQELQQQQQRHGPDASLGVAGEPGGSSQHAEAAQHTASGETAGQPPGAQQLNAKQRSTRKAPAKAGGSQTLEELRAALALARDAESAKRRFGLKVAKLLGALEPNAAHDADVDAFVDATVARLRAEGVDLRARAAEAASAPVRRRKVVSTGPTEEWAVVVERLVDEAERETKRGRAYWLQNYGDVSDALRRRE